MIPYLYFKICRHFDMRFGTHPLQKSVAFRRTETPLTIMKSIGKTSTFEKTDKGVEFISLFLTILTYL